MILKVFAMHDSKAEVYYQPFFLATTGLAIRTFTDLANDVKTQVGKYPADITLFQIADYDDNTGVFVPLKSFINLGNGLTFVTKVTSIEGGR